jgi:hypothetical protein
MPTTPITPLGITPSQTPVIAPTALIMPSAALPTTSTTTLPSATTTSASTTTASPDAAIVWAIDTSAQSSVQYNLIGPSNPNGTGWQPTNLGKDFLKCIAVNNQGQACGFWNGTTGPLFLHTDITSQAPTGTAWTNLPVPQRGVVMVANDPNGGIWGIGPSVDANGGHVYYFDPVMQQWTEPNPGATGVGMRLTWISAGNHVWGINKSGQIFVRSGNAWTAILNNLSQGGNIQGMPTQLSVGQNSDVWLLASNNLYYRQGNSPLDGNGYWIQINGSYKSIATGVSGYVLALNLNNNLMFTNSASVPFTQINMPSTGISQIAVGPLVSSLPAPSGQVILPPATFTTTMAAASMVASVAGSATAVATPVAPVVTPVVSPITTPVATPVTPPVVAPTTPTATPPAHPTTPQTSPMSQPSTTPTTPAPTAPSILFGSVMPAPSTSTTAGTPSVMPPPTQETAPLSEPFATSTPKKPAEKKPKVKK